MIKHRIPLFSTLAARPHLLSAIKNVFLRNVKIAKNIDPNHFTYHATASLYTNPATARRTTSKQMSDPSMLCPMWFVWATLKSMRIVRHTAQPRRERGKQEWKEKQNVVSSLPKLRWQSKQTSTSIVTWRKRFTAGRVIKHCARPYHSHPALVGWLWPEIRIWAKKYTTPKRHSSIHRSTTRNISFHFPGDW